MSQVQIMVVEDEGIVALSIQRSLEKMGYAVPVVVASGERAIEEAQDIRPDLVLMDIMLEGRMDGVEAAEQIRDRFNLPVVFLTAYADSNTLRRARISEPFGYLLKPFDERELHTTIEIALYRHKAEQALHRRDAILEAVSFAAERFLKATSWEKNIQTILERLGQGTGVSRVYIFENKVGDAKTETPLVNLCYEWTAPGINSQTTSSNLQTFSLKTRGLARWEKTLRQSELIHGHVRTFPENERIALAGQGVQSTMVVPIFVGDTWWGFIGFDECRAEREWSAAEMDALKAAASTLGAAIQRTQLHQQLQQRAIEMGILYKVATAGMASVRLDEVLNRTVAALQEVLQPDSLAILLSDSETQELVVRASAGLRAASDHPRFTSGESIPEWVVRTGRPVLADDLHKDPRHYAFDPHTRSELCVPLQVGERILGALNLESQHLRAFGENDLRLLSVLGGHLAVMIENAHLVQELQQYTTELEVRNEELDAFARTVAHDLKDPLGLVLGFARVLSESFSTLAEDDLREYLLIIERNARRMNNIISALLLLASVRKMEELEIKPLNMADIVNEAQERLAPMTQEFQAEIVLPPDESWPAALGYGPWIEEVWANYLSNAIKYGGRPPQMELGFEAQFEGAGDNGQPQVRFWVRDNGAGLTPQQQVRLFTPFTRLGSGGQEGHGLGLSIVRRIVEKLGGQVGVESEGVPGQGSVFSFTLPAA